MFENIAAIDIGTSSVKVVAVRTGLSDFRLKSLAIEEIDAGNENHTAAVIDAIKKIFQEENLEGYRIAAILPMEKVIIRNITFPFNDVEKIADAIQYEAEENTPFRRDDMAYDFICLKSSRENEGRTLYAAVHKDVLFDYISQLDQSGIKPVWMGMESIALFECYKYFNKIKEENVIQLDIGNNKSIVNIIQNDQLLFTRSISIGGGLIYQAVSKYLKIPYDETVGILKKINLDLTSFENNIKLDFAKSLGITRNRLKRIFDIATEIVHELDEQIFLTIKSLSLEFGPITFSRILISGGGSNITGLGTIISREFEIPVVSTPFLDTYKEQAVRTQFPIAFGIILSYVKQRRSSINFLKGEFIPDIAGATKRIYYLSGGFFALSLLILAVNFIVSLLFSYKSNRDHVEILNSQFKRYFNVSKIGDDPIAEAKKIYIKEKTKLDSITQLIDEGSSVLDLMKNMMDCFPKNSDFELKNIVINRSVVRIDGILESSKQIDEFKNDLIKSGKFDDVTVTVTSSFKNSTRFSMTIRQKSVALDSGAIMKFMKTTGDL